LEHEKLLTQNNLIIHRPESSTARNKYLPTERERETTAENKNKNKK